MGTSGHFQIENYAWRLGLVQNLCEYCRLFCMIFETQTVLITLDQNVLILLLMRI